MWLASWVWAIYRVFGAVARCTDLLRLLVPLFVEEQIPRCPRPREERSSAPRIDGMTFDHYTVFCASAYDCRVRRSCGTTPVAGVV